MNNEYDKARAFYPSAGDSQDQMDEVIILKLSVIGAPDMVIITGMKSRASSEPKILCKHRGIKPITPPPSPPLLAGEGCRGRVH